MERFPRPTVRWAFGALIAALVLGACAGPPAESGYSPITPDSNSVQLPDGLTFSVAPDDLTADYRVQLHAVAPDVFLSGEAEAEWGPAREALPGYLTPAGPVFGIQTAGTAPKQVWLAAALPQGASASDPLDLYAWSNDKWSFIPGRVVSGQFVAALPQAPSAVAVFKAGTLIPFASTTLEAGQTFEPGIASTMNAVYPAGLRLTADGSLDGVLVGGFAVPAQSSRASGQGYAVLPIIRNYGEADLDVESLSAVLRDDGLRTAHAQNLVNFAVADGYNGLVVDYRGVDFNLSAAFSRFVGELADGLHAQNKILGVVVEAATPVGDGYATGGYDWRAIGGAADFVELPAADDPGAYGNGQVDHLLAWAVGEISRYKLRLLTSSLSVSKGGDAYSLLDYNAALDLLGDPTLSGDLEALSTGQPIQVSLSGKIQALDYDDSAFAPRLMLLDDSGGTTTVWLTTSHTLLQRLSLAQKHRLGGVSVRDLFHPGNRPGNAEAVTQYKVNAAAELADPPGLMWTVSGANGLILESSGAPGQPFEYVAQAPGDYQIGVEFVDGIRIPLGLLILNVKAPVTPTIVPTALPKATQVPGSNTGGQATPVPTQAATQAPTQAPAAPVVLPKATGNFELGGQVINGIPVGPMQTAGMTWAKIQARGGDMSGFIASAHASGLKVVLTVLLDKAHAADPAYWPEVAAYAAGQAAAGADAIEVWNEMNIDAEWPTGQINPATYVEMLKVVYPAIKGANPNTLVVSGALAPTGAEGVNPAAIMNDDKYLAGMAAAGAANYMDCIGIHYNTGTTAPSATSGSTLSGYHYSYYFWPMVDLYYGAFGGARPLCFTELGYLSGEGYGALPPAFAWASGVTVAHQSAWLAEAASLAASSKKVRLMIVWNIDSTTWTHDPQAGYAIIRPDGSCPACSALGSVMR